MSLFFAEGSTTTEFSNDQLRAALHATFAQLGPRERVLALPPDFTRIHSQAGRLTRMVHEHFGSQLVDVMPALGTHDEMADWQIAKMFPGMPSSLFRYHDWRNDVVTIGQVPREFVAAATEGIYAHPWPAQLNQLVWEGRHDLILSIGQVVPHEVIGMANHNKNIFVGTGGSQGINESHYLSAVYGMERVMGRADTPLRRILNKAEELFCQHLQIVYVLTVIGTKPDGGHAVRGLFIGDDPECFLEASELALAVNFKIEKEQPQKIVALLDPEEFHSTWIGNKAVYRTRMLIADQGELIVLAPAVNTFGEDKQIDALIRKYGYRTSSDVLALVDSQDDLKANLSAAAHLIHGSSENRFTITYCPGHLSRHEIEGVGYRYGDLAAMRKIYDPAKLRDGWNEVDGERIYFVRNPALGLWAHPSRLRD